MIAMKYFRHHQMRARFAILAIVGMLWSQVVLAAHPLCSMEAIVMPETEVAMASADDDCHHEGTPSADDASCVLCAVHCSQGDQTNDVARVPVIPALPPAVFSTIVAFAFFPTDPAPHPRLPPPGSWHRPTVHPAAVLLI